MLNTTLVAEAVRRRWQFWIDRGGTFTDVIGVDGAGRCHVAKVLSEAPGESDAAVVGVRKLLGVPPTAPVPRHRIAVVRMGSTVATNALLERKGAKVALVITRGFKDLLRIRDQSRPELFDLYPRRNKPLYAKVIEVDERIRADGTVERPVDLASLRPRLEVALRAGIKAVAIVCMHGYRYDKHELQIAALCRQLGFEWVCPSAQTEPLIGAVKRGETTVVDVYLTPLLRHYVDTLTAQLGGVRVQFMQSNGGLTAAATYSGRNAILSGPAGGIIGAMAVAGPARTGRLVSFDMGGTSTDVAHSDGHLERTTDAEIAGVKLAVPMLRVNTVAAGGGSVCWYGAERMQVGPRSAGAVPGPACYGLGGPLTVTDCNMALGRLVPEAFPTVFGPDHNAAVDKSAADRQLVELGKTMGRSQQTPAVIAADFIDVAVERMANAIKGISVHRGHDLGKGYVLVSFGGAGGQHACQVAERLGVDRVLVHPLAGVLSAAGIGIAALRAVRQRTVELPLAGNMTTVRKGITQLGSAAVKEVQRARRDKETVNVERRVLLRYAGTAASLAVSLAPATVMRKEFSAKHKQMFGFDRIDAEVIIAGLEAEAATAAGSSPGQFRVGRGRKPQPQSHTRIYAQGQWHVGDVYARTTLYAGNIVAGPALILEDTATTYVAPNWQAQMGTDGTMILVRRRKIVRSLPQQTTKRPTPGKLEVFHSVFMSVAEQMGHVLRNTAASVNIKERLDFSCAVFDGQGNLVANAPHIPAHLGSMGATVQAVISANQGHIRPGDAWLVNAPYAGGTHLPDLTVVTPIFRRRKREPDFFVCSRGHHADIGGITPGSMPANSTSLAEEGILFDNFHLVRAGKFAEAKLRAHLAAGPYPARDPDQNVADLLAQLAANAMGSSELERVYQEHGVDEVLAYMGHIQDNAARAVRGLLGRLQAGSFAVHMDNGSVIRVAVSLNRTNSRATLDFKGTSVQDPGNANAPVAVVHAAVYYVLRCLLHEDIPLNAGCLRPISIRIPAGSLVNPGPAAAVAAGNVEVSQAVVDALLGALRVTAASQGTMNNLTFGNANYQYYETVCGGVGAAAGYQGMDAVHTHMTNTLITDVEVLEDRLPVLVERFGVRRGSGGQGRWRGGDGAVRALRFLAPMDVTMLANRRVIPPTGMAGGSPGRVGQNWVRRATGGTSNGNRQTWRVQPGDVFELRTPGGGGWGKPKTT